MVEQGLIAAFADMKPQQDVIRWVSATDAESRRLVEIGGRAGFLREAEGWNDYIADTDARFTPHHEALRQAIIARGLRPGDDWHQTAPGGAPVFDDGASGLLSQQAGNA